MKGNDLGFEIYSVEDEGERRLVQVSDKLHLEILHMLLNGPMSTTEISDSTHKAQSTLSVHLDQMVGQKLISSDYDKNDSRRKIFTCTSFKVAGSKDSNKTGINEANSMLVQAVNDPGYFYKGLYKAILMSAESNGMDVRPMMEQFGSNLAKILADKVKTTKVEDVLRNIQEFYEKNELGEVCIYTFMPLTIIIRDTEESQYRFECFAAFHHGLFRTLLSEVIGKEYQITMKEIFGTGNNYYKFIIDSTK